MDESPKTPSNVVAFFDFDRTLIDVNSGLLYVQYEREHGRLSLFSLLRVALWMVLYHLSLINMEKAYRAGLDNYIGQSEEDLRRTTRTWFETVIAQRLQPGAKVAIAHHRAEGHPIMVLTTSSQYVAEAARDCFELDGSISAQFATDDAGKLTGDLVGPLCYGAGKVVLSEAWAKERNVDLDKCYFYSDSLSDLPMLERVGHPRVVNPDFRLRKIAKKRGWQILDWREAIPVLPPTPSELPG